MAEGVAEGAAGRAPEGSGARRTFGPVVLLGVAAGALAAVAGSRPWLAYDADVADPVGALAEAGRMPLAAALSLVVLACWGVLLVTRGRVRRAVAWLGLAAALGVTAAVVGGLLTLRDDFPEPLASPHGGAAGADPGWTLWVWAAAAGALLSVAAAALAVRHVAHWPEMGSRYDAPADAGRPGPDRDGAAQPETDTDTDTEALDLWKAMDEGRDPTVREDPQTP